MGGAWELQCSDIETTGLNTGANSGYIVLSCGFSSINYGESWYARAYRGWYGSYGSPQIAGFSLGQGYVTNSDGILFRTDNYFDSLYVMYDFSDRVSLFRGSELGELYARKGLTIYYSSDYGESFIETGVHPIDGGLEFIAGEVSGEIFAAGVYINLLMGEVIGGHIEIWRSTDYGATWDFIRDHHAAIDEREITFCEEEFCERNGNIITSTMSTQLYNIHGKLLTKGSTFDLKNYQTGIYILSNGVKSKKIVNIK